MDPSHAFLLGGSLTLVHPFQEENALLSSALRKAHRAGAIHHHTIELTWAEGFHGLHGLHSRRLHQSEH